MLLTETQAHLNQPRYPQYGGFNEANVYDAFIGRAAIPDFLRKAVAHPRHIALVIYDDQRRREKVWRPRTLSEYPHFVLFSVCLTPSFIDQTRVELSFDGIGAEQQ
jgi:hypothetical protein